MKTDELASIMKMISGCFQNFKVTPDAATAWYALMGDCERELIERAVVAYCKTEKFPPTPGDILKLYSEFAPKELTAEEAWPHVIKAAGTYGRYHAPRARQVLQAISDRVYLSAKQTGWDRICSANIETELPFVRKDFIGIYDHMSQQHATDKRLGIDRKLIGDK